MKGVGTVVGMGVLYWIALGAATAVVVSAIAGVILVGAALFLSVKFVINRFQEATRRQVALAAGSMIVGSVSAAALFWWWWRGEYAVLNLMVSEDKGHLPIWASILIAFLPPLLAVTTFRIMTSGRNAKTDLLCALVCTVAIIAFGFVVRANVIHMTSSAQAMRYELICEHHLGAHTATYSVSGHLKHAKIEHIELVLDDDTKVGGQLRGNFEWHQTIDIGEEGSCAILDYAIEPAPKEGASRTDWEGEATCKITFEGQVVLNEETLGNTLRGGCVGHDHPYDDHDHQYS